jgi:hypothetical protein
MPRLINFSGLVYLCILCHSCLTKIPKQHDMQLRQLTNRSEKKEELRSIKKATHALSIPSWRDMTPS